MYSNNTSGYVGVSFDSKSNKYRAYVCCAGIKIRVKGFYQTPEDAQIARKMLITSILQDELPLCKAFEYIFPTLTYDEVCGYVYESYHHLRFGKNKKVFNQIYEYIANNKLTFNSQVSNAKYMIKTLIQDVYQTPLSRDVSNMFFMPPINRKFSFSEVSKSLSKTKIYKDISTHFLSHLKPSHFLTNVSKSPH